LLVPTSPPIGKQNWVGNKATPMRFYVARAGPTDPEISNLKCPFKPIHLLGVMLFAGGLLVKNSMDAMVTIGWS
jgi:hypothetical protein